MDKRTLLPIVLIITAFVFLAGLLLLLRGDEDSWMCENGQWVKHGFPSAPKPDYPCLVNGSGEEPLETMTVWVFFNNNRYNEEFSCQKVLPVRREIPKTEG